MRWLIVAALALGYLIGQHSPATLTAARVVSPSPAVRPAIAARAPAPVSPRGRARAVLYSVFGPDAGPCFLSIADRETGGTFDPKAANLKDVHSDGSRGSFGLLQIGAVHRNAGEAVAAFARRMFDPRANALMGRALYRAAGLKPWGGSCV